MECQIGEIRKVGNKWLQCIESACNKECYFYNRSLHKTIAGINGNDFGACNACFRSDDKSVIFKELEKIGGPYDDCGTILQRFKIYTNVTNADTKGLELHIYSNDTIGIEIKENKENMKERKIQHYDCFFNKEQSKPNLKPFSLELAKRGKPVCTRDGRQARIICFDRKDIKPIVALVTVVNDTSVTEKALYYFEDGHHLSKNYDDSNDLMMLPERRSGWVNVYRDCDGANITKDDNIYSSNDAAIASAQMIDRDNYVATVKIQWEE